MFNLFKHKQPVVQQEITQPTQPTNSYPEAVQQIHREFHFAAEKLLLEAKSVIAEAATKDAVKVGRLEKLGFKKAQQVVEIKPLLEKAKLSEEQVNLLSYYRREYPLNKFITESQVKEICYKYNLICGDVDRFKGFVPEKNLREIEKFNIKSKDLYEYEIKSSQGKFMGYVSKEDIDERMVNYLSANDENYVEFSSGKINVAGGNAKWGEFSKISKANGSLKICAPVKDMDLSGMTIEEGYKMTKIHIPDPVVLQPVRGGYLILTAWGDEASDPIVVNNINN